MRLVVQSLTGEALVVPVTTKAKLSFERTHKKAIDDELRSGMVGPVYEVAHSALLQLHGDVTADDFDEWLETVESITIQPDDLTTHLLRITRGADPDLVDGIADLLHGYAENLRGGTVEEEPDEVPTGGDPTPTPDGSPSPASGQDSTPTD